jgi:hypothetical protein
MRTPLRILAAATMVAATASAGFAATQSLDTKLLLVKDAAGPESRKIVWKVKQGDPDGELSVVGDPTTAGATLRVRLQVSNHCSVPPCEDGGGDQCFILPSSGWSPIGSIGFKYKDAALVNGAVKVASIKRTPSGNFLVKVIAQGAGIGLFLEDEIGFYGLNLSLLDGDDYQTGSGGAVPKPNDSRTFRVKSEDNGASQPPCSPSGAFVD